MGQTGLKVSLLSYTPIPDEVIAMAAKLCYSDSSIEEIKTTMDEEKRAVFIKRLMELGHLSPIEHASFTFGIEGVSRALLAQITRHRLASFSVQSQRYVNKSAGFNYIIPPSILALGSEAVCRYKEQMETMQGWYNQWVEDLGGNSESANQDARFVLPNACETKMVMTMNARELLHFFRLRCCNRAQWEIRALAYRMLKLCYDACPSIFAFGGAACANGPCSEGKMNCGKAKEVREFTKNYLKQKDESEQ